MGERFSVSRQIFLIFTVENDRGWGPVDQLGGHEENGVWLGTLA